MLGILGLTESSAEDSKVEQDGAAVLDLVPQVGGFPPVVWF